MENIYVGKTCPYCKTPFKQDDTIVVCNACFMPHHFEITNKLGGQMKMDSENCNFGLIFVKGGLKNG
jgi:uncharacterized Zn finger protein (UPF0148 family)